MTGTINIPSLRTHVLLGTGSGRYVRTIAINFDCCGGAVYRGMQCKLVPCDDVLMGWGELDGPTYLVMLEPDAADGPICHGNINKAVVHAFVAKHPEAKLF